MKVTSMEMIFSERQSAKRNTAVGRLFFARFWSCLKRYRKVVKITALPALLLARKGEKVLLYGEILNQLTPCLRSTVQVLAEEEDWFM